MMTIQSGYDRLLPPALTVRQPWATLILRGGKTVENRTWRPPTELLGRRLLIHAAARSVSLTEWAFAEACAERALDVADRDIFPYGVILGAVTVTGYHSAAAYQARGKPPCSRWAAAGPGIVHWTLALPRRFAVPVPCRGAVGLCRVPDPLRSALTSAIAGEPGVAG